jgi:hypothetical protein
VSPTNPAVVNILRDLGIVRWPLAFVLASTLVITAIIGCGILYAILKFGDSSIELAKLVIESLKGIALALIAELRNPSRHPAIKLESLLLIAFILSLIIFGFFWLCFQWTKAEGSRLFGVGEACILVAFIITAIQSASFAKHFFD